MRSSSRLRAVIAVATITILGVAAGVALAAGPDRAPRAAGDGPTATSSAKGSFSRVSPAATARPSGGSVRRQLRQLAKAHNRLVRSHNRLVGAHNQLARAFYDCEEIVPVTQYFGYDYNGNIGATTALDFTDPGDPVDEEVVTWIC